MSAVSFLEQYEDLAERVEEVSKIPQPTGPHNLLLRQIYSKLELLLLDVEETNISLVVKDVDEEFYRKMEKNLDNLRERLDLVPIKRRFKWWRWIDISFRFVGEITCQKLQINHCTNCFTARNLNRCCNRSNVNRYLRVITNNSLESSGSVHWLWAILTTL